jgi:hypothetical protein
MSERFKPPQFFKEGIEPKPMYGKEYGEGAFTVVAKLENLPANVRERVPQGYVVKQYKMSEHDWDFDIETTEKKDITWADLLDPRRNEREKIMQDLRSAIQSLAYETKCKPTADELHQYFIEESRRGTIPQQWEKFLDRAVLQKWWDESSLMGMGKELRRRHELVRAHFRDVLPNLIVDTQFVIGSPDGSREQARLYEVQKQIVPLQVWQRMQTELLEAARLYKEDWDEYHKFVANNPLYRAYSGISIYYRHGDENSGAESTEGKRLVEGIKYVAVEGIKYVAEAVRTELADKPKKLKLLKTELRKLIARAKTLPGERDWLPFDLPWLDNLVLAEDGLRVIDTNQGFQPSQATDNSSKEDAKKYTRSLEILKIIRENL